MMFRKSLVGLNRRVRYSCAVYAQCSYTGYQNGSAIALCQHSRQIFPSHCGVRHTSGNPVVPPVITKAFEAATPASNETSVSSSIESLVQSIGPIPEAPLLPPPKVIELLSNGEPSISSLGLGGFSPVGIIQHILELVHVSTGLSWGWTIVIVAVSIRMLCFKLVVRQRQESKKFAANYPQTQFLQQKMTEARQQNDIIAMSKYSHEFREHIQNANSFGAMKYAFFNGGILISLTLALRGMCDLPVESFRTGGFEFIPDLTMSDPTCILPAINGTLLYLHFLFSKDLNNMLPNLSPLALQGIMVALGTSLGLFSLKFQGAIVMYWISSQCVTVLQYHYLNRPSVLKKYGLDKAGQTSKIAELMKADKAKRGLRKLGFIAQFKETQANARLAEEVKRRSHLDSAAFERAGREPIRKVYNYDITKVKKM